MDICAAHVAGISRGGKDNDSGGEGKEEDEEEEGEKNMAYAFRTARRDIEGCETGAEGVRGARPRKEGEAFNTVELKFPILERCGERGRPDVYRAPTFPHLSSPSPYSQHTQPNPANAALTFNVIPLEKCLAQPAPRSTRDAMLRDTRRPAQLFSSNNEPSSQSQVSRTTNAILTSYSLFLFPHKIRA